MGRALGLRIVETVDLRVDVERVDRAGLVRVLEGDLDPGARRFRRRNGRLGDDGLRGGDRWDESGEEESFHGKGRGER